MEILEKNGVSSQTAEREIRCMADTGNTVACKLYADMIFYKKILRKNPYREAFALNLKAAGIRVNGAGEWLCSGRSYPLAFWTLGYYLVNYRRDSFLQKCETIDVLQAMSLEERLSTALELAVSCIEQIGAPAAINLLGRILHEASENEALLEALAPTIRRSVENKVFRTVALRELGPDTLVRNEGESADLPAGNEGESTAIQKKEGTSDEQDIYLETGSCRPQSPQYMDKSVQLQETYLSTGSCRTAEECFSTAEYLFKAAARKGYVYASNNLAAREAEHAFSLYENGASSEELDESIRRYVHYLTLSASRYEPYAANRLGLFFTTGELLASSGKVPCREYINYSLAKEFFKKATVCPNANSAWAFLNLIKYFHQDYDNNIELLNEHMDYIKELNPEVYDIAMEL